MVLERKGPVSTATRNCQNHVQRLRSKALATLLPGSQGLDPRTLRPERLKWLSMPHPARPDGRRSITSSASAMGLNATAKSWPAAEVAAFPNTCEASVSRRTATAVCLQTAIAVLGGRHSPRIVLRRAFAHHLTIYLFDGRKGQGSAGTDPSTLYSQECEMT